MNKVREVDYSGNVPSEASTNHIWPIQNQSIP